jgi:Right handed beta helix region
MKQHRIPSTIRRAALGATIAVVGVPAMAAADRPPAVTCGSVVTSDVRLTGDLSCAGPGLVIGAAGVRIDLGGHTLSGPGDGVGIDGNGGFDGLTIRNGTITGFLHGIDLVETDRGRIAQVVVTGNGRGINISRSIGMEVDRVVVDDNRFDGLSVAFSEQTTVRRSAFTRNGVSGVNELASSDSTYDRDVAVDNELHGITVSQSDGLAITRTEASGNGGDGIDLGFWAFGAILEGNGTSGNAGDGIGIDEAGSSIRRHTAQGNAGIGIAAAEGTDDGGRNRASGNGGGDCTNVACG